MLTNTEKISRSKITSSDCVLPEMAGKFDLVFYVSQRARAILNGSLPLVEGFDNPKNHSILVAMEEIRQKKLTFEDIMHSLTSPDTESKEPERAEALSSLRQSQGFDDEDEEETEEVLNYKTEEEYED
jgi:DNA-directed RNA polymerase subunit K/omega